MKFKAAIHYHTDGLAVYPLPKDSLVPINSKEVSPPWGYWAGNPFYRCFVVWREWVDIIGGIEDIHETRHHRNAHWAGRGTVEVEVEMNLSPYEFEPC